ncbi:MAG: InlB B-repeat-containing protein, partial [Solobacterium sp.]|nr:InlB B-repeat-containing protein [Solobacterium sp.]
MTWNANGGYFLDGDDEVTSIITYTAPGDYPDQPEPYIGDESKMFDRWSTSPDGTGDDISEVTGPVTYYAIWINAYTITLDAGEGYFGIWDWDDEEEDEVYIQKKTFTFKKAEGYRFWEEEIDDLWDGWEISGPEGKGFAGWKMTGTDWEEDDYYGERYFLVESDVTITAQWGINHTITWDANGGYFPDEDDETMERTYVEGEVLYNLPEPETSDPHKIFVGWTDVQGSTDVLTYNEDIGGYLEITEDMTLYAAWEDGYIVTFHGCGGEYGSEDWDDEEDDWVTTFSPTKVCKYRKNSVLQSHDGEFETWDYDRIPDKKYLKGWSLTEGGPVLEYDEELGGLICVDRDLDLYAVWEDDYDIVIDPNGGYWWDSEADHKYYDVRTWKSSYTAEEGQISFLELRAGLYNDEQRMAVVGFSTDPEGENIVIRADGEQTLPVTSDMMLYAVWEPGVIISLSQAGYIDEERTILVNAMQWHWKWDGEHVSQTVPQNIPISRVAMPLVYKYDEPDWDGFAGWSLSPYKKDIIRGDGADGSYVLTEDVMLYPILRDDTQEPETYVLVVWDANGGTFAQDGYPSKTDQQVGVGTALGEAGIPQLNERSGYELAGWSTNADAQEPDYTSSEIAAYTVTEAVTFYAVWKVKEPEGNTTAQELADDVNDIIGQAAAASTDEEKAAVERAIEDLVETLDNNDNQAIIDSATEQDPQLAAMNSQMDQLLQGQGYGDVEIGSTIAAEAPISPGSSENIVVSMSGAAATVANQIRKDLENDEIDPEALGEDETITYHAQVVVGNVAQSAASLDLAMDISVSVVADIPGEEPKVEEHVSLTAPVTVSMILPESYQGKEFDLMHETNEGVAQIPYDSNNVTGGLAVSFAVPGCSMFRIVNVRCTNHSFDEIGELYQEATCTSNEVRKYHCQNAGCSEYQLNEIPGTMKAHEYETTGTVIKDPTCTEEGTIVYNCRNCTHTKEETIAKIAHTEEVIPAVEPTCTKAGQTAGKKCSVCGTILIAPTSRPATGVHSWSAWTVTKAATCSASGTQTHTCSVCKTTETQTIAATGKHTPVAIAAVPATCTAAGKTAGSKCSVCGTVITAQKTVPATGHKWDAGKVTTEPTASAAGVKTYTCTVCNATKTEPIQKLTPAEAQKKAEGDPNDPKSVAGAEKAMTAVKDNGEPKGSSFSTIQLYSSKQTKNSITLKWNKVKGASGYIIYG